MTNESWLEDDRRIGEYYAQLVRQHGVSPRALDWGSRQSQELRFRLLTQIGDLEGTSLLDVGCGLADLYDFLQHEGTEVNYTGFDLNPQAVDVAQRRFPCVSVQVRDLVQNPEPPSSHDYVFASGIFYLRQHNPMGFMEAIVGAMFQSCRRGIAFNTLSLRAPHREADEFYADPHQVLDLCWSLSPRVVLRHDYLPHDFTVYLYKDDS